MTSDDHKKDEKLEDPILIHQGHDIDDTSTLVDAFPAPETLTYHPNTNGFNELAPTLVNGTLGSIQLLSSRNLSSFQTPVTSSVNAQILNMKYNENRVSLDRAINQSINILHELSKENQQRPVFYPTTNDDDNTSSQAKRAHEKAKIQDLPSHDVSPPEFKLLRLDLKMGHSGNNATAHLDKHALATLLEQQLKGQVRYLINLRDRIDDTLLKVFVTGDLNAGKLSFCNKLLRRKLLPEDQQPCTQVFCEVIDARKDNQGIEEVHAVYIDKEYRLKDESLYKTFPLKGLQTLVNESDKYSMLKVYVLDERKHGQLLLANGVVDVKLIDAPGLNMDLYQTTQVFLRQEEIDLVVFVVNAENHFTLSGKEFISTAAAEKRYVFIVVNKFDNIKDKEKCQNKILDQVKDLSPDTHKSAGEFVHFVNSEDPDGGPDGNDDPEDEDEDPEFSHLEASLRKFLLDKRSMLKLLPAKSYLNSLLHDLHLLANLNEGVHQAEKQSNIDALNKNVTPVYEDAIRNSAKINDRISLNIETLCTQIYDSSREELSATIRDFGDKQVVPYLGLNGILLYAQLTQKAMIDTVLSLVQYAEGQAKLKTADLVESVISLGKETLGDEFLLDKVFNPALMFTRKKDTISRALDTTISFGDFFDPSWESFVSWIGIPQDFQRLVGSQVGDPTALLGSIPTTADDWKKHLVPRELTVQTLYSATKFFSVGAIIRKAYMVSQYVDGETVRRVAAPVIVGLTGVAIGYLVYDIPNAFPRKRARKIRKQLLQLDYPHKNAYRISQECRRVLAYPARQVMTNFQTSIDKKSVEKQELEKKIADADLSYKYFHNLLQQIDHQTRYVEAIDLDSINNVD